MDNVIRRLDELGRITIPIEARKQLYISERDPLELSVKDGGIFIKKYEPQDYFNGRKDEELFDYCGKKVAKSTIIELAKLAGIIN